MHITNCWRAISESSQKFQPRTYSKALILFLSSCSGSRLLSSFYFIVECRKQSCGRMCATEPWIFFSHIHSYGATPGCQCIPSCNRICILIGWMFAIVDRTNILLYRLCYPIYKMEVIMCIKRCVLHVWQVYCLLMFWVEYFNHKQGGDT